MGFRYGDLWHDYVALKKILSNTKLSYDEKLKYLIDKKAYINSKFKNHFDANDLLRFIKEEINKIKIDINMAIKTQNNALHAIPFTYEIFAKIIHETGVIPNEIFDAKLEFLKNKFESLGFSPKTGIVSFEFFLLEYENAFYGYDCYFSQKKCKYTRTDVYFYVNTPTIDSFAGLKILLVNADTFFLNYKKIIQKFKELYINYPTIDETAMVNQHNEVSNDTLSTVQLQEYDSILFTLKKIYDLYNESSIMDARLFIEKEYFPSMNLDKEKGYVLLRNTLKTFLHPTPIKIAFVDFINNKSENITLKCKNEKFEDLFKDESFKNKISEIINSYDLDKEYLEKTFCIFHLSPNSKSFNLLIDINKYHGHVSDNLVLMKNTGNNGFIDSLIYKYYYYMKYVLLKLNCLEKLLMSENRTIYYYEEFFNIFRDFMLDESLSENMVFSHKDISVLIKLINKKIEIIEFAFKNEEIFNDVFKSNDGINDSIFQNKRKFPFHQEYMGHQYIPNQFHEKFDEFCNFILIKNENNENVPIPNYIINALKPDSQNILFSFGKGLIISTPMQKIDYFKNNGEEDNMLIYKHAIKAYWSDDSNRSIRDKIILNNMSENMALFDEITLYEGKRYVAWEQILKFPDAYMELFQDTDNSQNNYSRINLSDVQIKKLYENMNNIYFETKLDNFKLLCKNKRLVSKIKWTNTKNGKIRSVNVTTLRAFCSFLLNITDYSFPPKFFVNDNFIIENKNEIKFNKVKEQDKLTYNRHIFKFNYLSNNSKM